MKLIRGGTVWLPDPQGPGRFEEGVDILIEGATIAQIGPNLEPPGGRAGLRVIDAAGKLVVPGFVNAHTHVAMTLLRSYADDLPLQAWLTEKIWPVESRLTPEDVYWGTLLGIVEMIRAGVTTFADMYFYMDQVARAVEESGIRAALAPGMFDRSDWDEQIESVRSFAEAWQGRADGRIRVMFGPHAPYSAFAGLKPVAQAAKELGLPVHIHLSETKREVDESLEAHGLTPIALAEREGIFEAQVLAAHCVHVTSGDMEILRAANASVVHNPTSNMKLGSGRAPVQEMLDRGILVALGTDGASSNNNLDLLEEARLAAFLAKMEGEPASLPAAICLRMATENGGRALGFPGVGVLKPGCQADVVVIDASGAHWTPPHDPCANLIYSSSSRDVETVLVAGEILMERGALQTVDEERILSEAKARGIALVNGA